MRKLLRTLLVIDRATGETERIREDDGNFRASIALAAEKAEITYDQAMDTLLDGQELLTSGFIRKLEELPDFVD